MVRITISVPNISFVLDLYSQVKVYYDNDPAGAFATEVTGPTTRIALTPGTTKYTFDDPDGTNSRYYKVSYFNPDTGAEGNKSAALQGGTEVGKIGYTFGNYSPPKGEWGKIYTADDIRYTMLFGIDCIGSDIAQSEFSDEQFDQIVLESLGEFEGYLDMDIRRRSYKTFQSQPSDGHTRSRFWRDGVDYTHEDEPYDFDPQEWSHYGFVQLRHWPVIKVTRAVWMSPIQSEIIDMVDQKWVRLDKQFGQVRMFPTQGVTYGPFSVYGSLWTGMGARRYPGGFEFDYETGYESADFVPEGLRATVAKYATIKALAAVGDGILAGFSSQSVSLDGLSESFSSTQSATSAYFGARIKQYSDEIKEWLVRNRYKYSPVGISFVGSR